MPRRPDRIGKEPTFTDRASMPPDTLASDRAAAGAAATLHVRFFGEVADLLGRAAVAQELAVGDPWVLPGQEVAFFSAFSGG